MDLSLKMKIAGTLIKNGYLIHCTNENFNVFDPKYIKGGFRAKEGYGFYFSDMSYKPIEYGDIFKVIKKDKFNFLDSKSPINMNWFGDDILVQIHRWEERLYSVRNNDEYDRIQSKIEHAESLLEELGGMKFLSFIENTIKGYKLQTIGSIEYYIANPIENVPKLVKLYQYYGYDGYETDGIYTVFNFEKLNKLVKTIDVSKYMNESTSKPPYEANEFKIGFEGDNTMNYAHITEEIDLSSFDIKDELNPKIWKDNKLNSRIRLKLLDIADDFTDSLQVDWVKPKDIIITGSIANYNWSEEYSDIDLHILYDFKKVDKRVDFVKNYFDAKKKNWNEEHQNIKIFGFNVELYVQDVNEVHSSTGVYSIEKNKWIIEPEPMDDISDKILSKAENEANKWQNKIDKVLKQYTTNATDSQKEKIIDNIDKMINDLKKYRKVGMSRKNAELSKNNIGYKMLRRNGYLDKMYNTKTQVYDDLMSIDENQHH